MRTIGIGISIAALAIGAHSLGYINWYQVAETAVPYLQQAEILEKDPTYIIIGVDITAGREAELESDFNAILAMLRNMGPGDRVDIILIHGKSESAQDAVYSCKLPKNPGPAGQLLKRAKQNVGKDFDAAWKTNVFSPLASKKKGQTDLFGFMRLIAKKEEFMGQKNAWLILFTDGLHVGDGMNMEKKIPALSQLARLKKDELLPELHRIHVRLLGMTATHNISNNHYREVKKFWHEYCKEAGVESVEITSERPPLSFTAKQGV